MKLKYRLLLSIVFLLTAFNSYSQWYIVGQLPYAETGTQQPVYIKFYDENIGYAELAGIGADGWFEVQVKTTDGGVSWRTTSLPTTAYTKAPVFMGDAQHFVLAPHTDGTPSYRTADGGTTFVAMPDLSSSWANFYFKNTLKGFYFLSTYLQSQNMRSTIDGGLTWSSPQPSNPPLSDMYFPDPNGNLGFLFAGNTILKTTNNGTTWNTDPSLNPAPVNNRFNIAYTSPQVWYVGSQTEMARTQNGFYIKGPEYSGYQISNTESVYRTRDGGVTWEPFGEGFEAWAPGSDSITDFSFPTNQVGYAVTYSGKVYKLDNLLAIKQIQSSKLGLYPNPTKDFLFVEGDNISSKSYAVYDLMGRKILSGTIYFNKIDVSNLANGPYLLKIDGYETVKFKIE